MIKKISSDFFAGLVLAIAVFLPLQNATASVPNEHSRFKVYLPADGLDNGEILAVYQDSFGYMWFGGFDGLIRFDGYDFEKFVKHDNDSSALQHNTIRALVEDAGKNLWIATDGGLHRFDRDKNRFEYYSLQSAQNNIIHALAFDAQGVLWLGTDGGLAFFDPRKKVFHYPESAPSSVIYSLLIDLDNSLWVGTASQGLLHYSPKNQNTINYLHDENDPNSLPHKVVKSIFRSRDGVLWLGTYAGLAQFDAANRSFRRYQHEPGNSESLSGPAVYGMVEDEYENLWIATNNGLSIFDRKKEKFIGLHHVKNDPTTIASNKIRSIFKDKNQDVWLGNFPQGVSFFNRGHLAFETLRSDVAVAGQSVTSVLSLMEDGEGQIWLGTDGAGLQLLDKQGQIQTISQFKPDSKCIHRCLSSNFVLDLVADQDGSLWLGTWGGGLNHVDLASGRFAYYSSAWDNKNAFVSKDIWSLLVDSKNRLWVGAIGGFLSRYQRDQDRFVTWFHDPANPRSLSSSVIWTIHEDREGRIWIGSDKGLNRYDEEQDAFIHYLHRADDSASLSHDVVLTIHDDAAGNLWLGTRGGGLNRLHVASGKITRYGLEQGLTNLVVASIEEDEFGNLWLGTHGGLLRFNPATEVFRHFDRDEGLQGHHFNINASIKLKDGRLMFGGTEGITRFHPRDIPFDLPPAPSVVLRNFEIKHRPVYADGKHAPLSSAIDSSEEITVDSAQSVLTLTFSALDYRQPENMVYTYTLKGFDEQWYEVGKTRSATYTNLDPGKYEFWVKASRDGRQWSAEPRVIKLTVQPSAAWLWSRFLIAVLLVSAAFVLFGKFIGRVGRVKRKYIDGRAAWFELVR